VRAGSVLPWAPSASALVEVKDTSVRQDFTLPAGGKLAGQVLGPDGSLVAGATVMAGTRDSDAMDAPFRGDGRAVTDAEGRFTIGGLGAGKIELEIVDKRWGRLQDQRLVLGAGQTLTTTLTFPTPASVTGVVSWESGGPAAGVRVRWIPFGRGGREPETITDRAGRFQLSPCSPGVGVVQAELPTEHRVTGGGPGPNKRQLELVAGATAADVALVLARNDKTIAGVVLDPSGRPLADATVGVEEDHGQGSAVEHRAELMVRTDPEGRFLLERLVNRRYVLWATHADYPAVDRPGTEAGTSGHRLRFAAGATLAGTVKDERGAPAPLYTLLLVAPEGPGHTNGFGSGRLIGREEKVNDAGGAFSIARVAPGSYDLLVTAADGRVARAAALTVGAGERKEGLALLLRPAVTLRGKVVDSDTGAPLAGARVAVMGTRVHVHATSDASGAFALTGQIPGRTLMVQVAAGQGYLPSPREITVPDRDAVDLRPFRLMPDPRQGKPGPGDIGGAGDAGLRLADREDGMVIEAVAPGSPAARHGLRPGDRVTAVGKRDVRGMGAFAAGLLLRGPVGSTVEVTLDGPGGRTVAVERSATPVVASGR
jgi:protocatechuate 3,4-dioxygenase beta subunit